MNTARHAPSEPTGVRYASADLAMADGKAFWAIHATDPGSGTTGTWIASASLPEAGAGFVFEAWIPEAVQAIAAGPKGTLWGITAGNALLTNAAVHGKPGWRALDAPGGVSGGAWLMRELAFLEGHGGTAPADVVDCLLWTGKEFLIGTFGRRIFRWNGGDAVLEDDRHAGLLAGGINGLVNTAAGIFALGYGGTLLHRQAPGQWSPLAVPWSEDDAAFVNLVAGAAAPDGSLCVVAEGGWVLAADQRSASVTHRIDAPPLGIVTFQDDLYAATLDGCLALPGNANARSVKGGAGLGKMIGTATVLLAIDALPEHPDGAALHMWERSRTVDRWTRHAVQPC